MALETIADRTQKTLLLSGDMLVFNRSSDVQDYRVNIDDVIPLASVISIFGTASGNFWLPLIGETLGDTGSGADYTGAFYFNLYSHIWDLIDAGTIASTYMDTAKGASAAADYAAGNLIYLPDMRELAPVGVGTNAETITSIAAHDVFVLGTPKDDQLQGFAIRTRALAGSSDGPPVSSDGGEPLYNTLPVDIVTDGTNGTPRTGTVTRGKRIGMNFYMRY